MPANSPQAILPEYRSVDALIRDQVIAQKLIIDPPKLIEAAGEAFDDAEGVCIRVLQNCGTTACYYKVVDDKDFSAAAPATNPSAAAKDWHGIIAGGSAQDDGLGSIVDFSRFKGRILVAAVSGGVRLATFQARGPESGMVEGINNPNN